MVIIDQNLGENPLVLGTHLAKRLREHCLPETLVTLIRSGNSMTEDIKLYLEDADGLVEKNDSYPVLRTKVITQLTILAEQHIPESIRLIEDVDIEEMEARALKEMKAGLIQDIVTCLSMDHHKQWESSQKQLHLMKGSIKGLQGMMADSPDPPPNSEKFNGVVVEIDNIRANFETVSDVTQATMVNSLRLLIFDLQTWLKSW